MAEIVNMNYIDWDHPLLEGQTLIQNLVKADLVQAGTILNSVCLTTRYIGTYSSGSTWGEALADLFSRIEGEFDELKSERAW